MTLKEISNLSGCQKLNEVNLLDKYTKIINSFGKPIGILEKKKYGLKIINYDEFQMTFINDKLVLYRFVVSEKTTPLSFETVTKLDDNFVIGKENDDYISIQYLPSLRLVFSKEDDNLCEIIIGNI